MTARLATAAAAVLALLCTAPARAISIGTFNGFAAGNVQGWASGPAGTQPTAVAGGGPAGAADAYLRIVPGGGAGRLVAFAGSDWNGNYTLAGVTGITMDVRNFGTTELDLRLWLSGPFSTTPVVVAPGSGWQHVFFPIAPASLTGAGAPLTVTQLRLYHSALAVAPTSADATSAVLGIDNVRAVPEPPAVVLLLGGLGLAVATRSARGPSGRAD